MTVKRERRSASGNEQIWTKETEQIKNCAAAQFFLFLLAAFFTADQKDGDQYEDNRNGRHDEERYVQTVHRCILPVSGSGIGRHRSHNP